MGPEKEETQALIDILSGRSFYGWLHGTIKINGVIETNMNSFHNTIGYVGRKDVLQSKFRVREELRFAAHTRLSASVSFKDVGRKIDTVLKLLDIDWIQNKYIGVPGKPLGFSESQFRRISIGNELVADPSSLFFS